MRRCPQTDAVLEAAFGPGTSSANRDHAAACPECARALATARRFENELRDTGLGLSPEPMPAPEEVVIATDGAERRFSGPWRWVAGASVTAVLAVAFFAGGQWLGDSIGPLFGRHAGNALDVAAAAALAGMPPSGMLETDNGAVGVRAEGDHLELVLVRDSGEGLEEHVLATAGKNEIHVVRCGEVEIVWGHRPGVDRIEGPGTSATWDRQYAVFVFTAGEPKSASVQLYSGGRRLESLRFTPSELSNDECSAVIPRSDDGP